MNMKKKVLRRCMLGIPIGIAIGYVITILTSLVFANGYYAACVPELVTVMGNEIQAVVLQAILCGILGAGFSGSSVIWEMENWSLIKQTGLYFIIVSLVMMPVAYFTYWMEHSISGFLSYFGVFVMIFIFIWAVQLVIMRHHVKQLNEHLQGK